MRGGGGGLRGVAFWICLTSGEGASTDSRRDGGGGGGFCCRGDGVAGGGGLRGDALAKLTARLCRGLGKVLSYPDKCETYDASREWPYTGRASAAYDSSFLVSYRPLGAIE